MGNVPLLESERGHHQGLEGVVVMQERSSGGLRRPAVVSLQQEEVKRQEGAQHRRVCTDSVHRSAHIPL